MTGTSNRTHRTAMKYWFRIVNVFTRESEPLSGNPLCVFEDARGLSGEQMQALARQFNLSETTFVLPSSAATARVRIFTPAFEMPFAGHPTLGTAHVVRALHAAGDEISLEMQAGIIPVAASAGLWTLRANAPQVRVPEFSPAQCATMLGVSPEDLGSQPLWVNTGVEQLIVPLRSAAAVRRSQPDVALLSRHASLPGERCLAYVWAAASDEPARDEEILARLFFGRGTAIAEDPATGSAAANLGGWFLATGAAVPLKRLIRQGEYVQRPSELHLRVDAARQIFVSGRVLELAHGAIDL